MIETPLVWNKLNLSHNIGMWKIALEETNSMAKVGNGDE
jgi:hypothetical protein